MTIINKILMHNFNISKLSVPIIIFVFVHYFFTHSVDYGIYNQA